MAFLLIDFGASRVKVALYLDGILHSVKDYPPVLPINSQEKHFEVSITSLLELFYTIVDEYLSYSLAGIIICSEMHGFTLQDSQGNFVTNYISWQDNRATDLIDGVSTLEFIKQEFPTFKQHTGMGIRTGLPAVNFLHLIRGNKLPKGNYKMISLPEIFGATHIHSTLLAGLGIWDIYNNEIYKDLKNYYQKMGYSISTNQPSTEIVQTSNYKGIPIYTAVGDNQCALYGVQLKKDQVILNLGTGSQVVFIDQLSSSQEIDQRPYFHDQTLSIITHIPSGRALNCFMEFIEDCILYGRGTKTSWDILSTIPLEDILQSSLSFDLAVFESAYGFSKGGAITGIKEKSFSLKSYVSSLIYSYVNQYITIIKRYNLPTNNIILIGGISKKLPVIKQVLEHLFDCTVTISDDSIDESILGLQFISDTIIKEM